MNPWWAALSQGERIIVTGAALIFVVAYLLLGDIAGGLGVEGAVAICSALAIAFAWVEHSGGAAATAWPFPYPVVQLILVVIVGLLALDSFLRNLLGGQIGRESGIDIVTLLCLWVGAAAMAYGWYLDWRGRRRA